MANAIYWKAGTTQTWIDTSTPNTMTLNNLAAGAGRIGDIADFVALSTARPIRYEWRVWVQFATTPVVGETVWIYILTSDGSHPDNDDGTTDIGLSSTNKLNNLRRIGTLIVDEAATGVTMVAHGMFEEPARYIAPVIFNNTADNLVATNDVSGFAITPIYAEVQ